MKKIKFNVDISKRRNPIAKALCTQGQFKNKVFENKKRKLTLKRFDWRKDMNGNRFGSRWYLWLLNFARA
ncbi:MAG: hypothetical protein MRZ56_06025 [Sutterella sp.]|nr:hypothetical protein [Sutterella sp.]